MIEVVLTLASAVAAGILTAAVFRWFPQTDARRPALIGAFVAVFITASVLSIFIAMISTGSGLVAVDAAITRWAAAHATATSLFLLGNLTHAGDSVMVAIITVLTVAYAARRPDRWKLILFMVLVVGGQVLLANVLKISVGRVRPAVPPFDISSGPAFPSGHATAAAAVWAAVAFVLGKGRSRRTRAAFAGIAAGLAVAVACSRVFIGAHWTSDVIAGLLLGWTWFGVCAAAFSGRMARSSVV